MGVGPLRADDPATIGGYRVQGRIGAGGMGVVYLAHSPDGPVAIKILRREYAEDHAFRARFRREAAVLTRVDGAFTARVLAVDVNAPDPYLVLEYVDGPSLAARVAESGPLPPDMVRVLAAGLAAALAAIHRGGIVHRDLKPANVLLSPQGPKVIDFGIAWLADMTSVTETGVVIGSPAFMAPEQITGRPGPPADVFSWAVTVAYAATGRAVFGTGMAQALMLRIMHGEPDLDGVADELKPVLMAALDKDPDKRPTPSQLVAAVAGGDATTVTQRPDEAATALLTEAWQQSVDRTRLLAGPGGSRRRRVLTAGSIAALLVAAGVVTTLVMTLPAQSSGVTGASPPTGTTGSTSTTLSTSRTSGAPCTVDDITIEGGDGKPGVVIPDHCAPPAQVVHQDVRQGTGTIPLQNEDVTFNYTLITWSDRRVVQSTYDSGQPHRGQVSVGSRNLWDQYPGLLGMRRGGQRILVVPPGTLATYQADPNETVVVVIDLA
nr:protein kinase [Kibdelosporangium sp. MJ126-NF4]CEL17935.1 putative serine/threonine protein kinase [Kibdelosporangium sp. MJ126-NF4]CTQ90838.1 putative serine/threonine protein kinase [Kibdelosporangium sp. MJ126-NF4]